MPERRSIFQLYFISYVFFPFQQKVHQSTNTYNYHANVSTVGRGGCSIPDESFGYFDSNRLMGQYLLSSVINKKEKETWKVHCGNTQWKV